MAIAHDSKAERINTIKLLIVQKTEKATSSGVQPLTENQILDLAQTIAKTVRIRKH